MDGEKFDLENFVLNSGLNESCLLAVFDNLSVIDLLKLCDFNDKTDPEFVKFMQERVMNTKLFDLPEIVAKQSNWSILRIFEIFGKSMSKLKVRKSE